MEVHDAVRRAKSWVADMFSEEGIEDVGLEEVDFDDTRRIWNVTVGFSRLPKGFLANVAARPSFPRTYKIVKVSDEDGKVLSLRNRDIQ